MGYETPTAENADSYFHVADLGVNPLHLEALATGTINDQKEKHIPSLAKKQAGVSRRLEASQRLAQKLHRDSLKAGEDSEAKKSPTPETRAGKTRDSQQQRAPSGPTGQTKHPGNNHAPSDRQPPADRQPQPTSQTTAQNNAQGQSQQSQTAPQSVSGSGGGVAREGRESPHAGSMAPETPTGLIEHDPNSEVKRDDLPDWVVLSAGLILVGTVIACLFVSLRVGMGIFTAGVGLGIIYVYSDGATHEDYIIIALGAMLVFIAASMIGVFNALL